MKKLMIAIIFISAFFSSCQTLKIENDLSTSQWNIDPGSYVFIKCVYDPQGASEVLTKELLKLGLEVQPYETLETAFESTTETRDSSSTSSSRLVSYLETNIIIDISYSLAFVGIAYGGYGPDPLFIRIIDVKTKRTLGVWEYRMDLWSFKDRSMNYEIRLFVNDFRKRILSK